MSIQHIVSANLPPPPQKKTETTVSFCEIGSCTKVYNQKLQEIVSTREEKSVFAVKISCHMVMNNKLLLKSSKDHIKKSHPKQKSEVQKIGMFNDSMEPFYWPCIYMSFTPFNCLQDLSRATGNVENLLDLLQADKPVKFEWIKRRIRAMWPRWQAAFSSLKKKRNLSNTVQKKVSGDSQGLWRSW